MPGPVESCVILFVLLWSCWLHSLWVIHASSFSCAFYYGLSSHFIPVNLIGSEWLHAKFSLCLLLLWLPLWFCLIGRMWAVLLQDSAMSSFSPFTQPAPVGLIGCEWLHAQSSYNSFYDTSCPFGSISLILGCEWLYSKCCVFSHHLQYQFLL